MRIGMVISGGDVTGINNFIFQIARMTQAEMILFNGGIPGLLDNVCQEIFSARFSGFFHYFSSGNAVRPNRAKINS